jgi:Domain of unknown function (DUF929)
MSAISGSVAGGTPRQPNDTNTRRAAAQQRAQRRLAEQQRRKRQRQRLWTAGIATAAVVVVVLTMVIVSRTVDRKSPTAAAVPSGQAANAVVGKATSVPAAVLDQAGRGTVMVKPLKVTGQQSLAEAGKPLVVYIGAEYCPFCAAQRWPVVVALSRFGTFTSLGMTHSASDDTYPNTQSFSFHGATYTSQYIAFQGVETATNKRQGNGYAPLDALSDQQENIMKTLDAPPYVNSSGGIPFMDLGNRYLLPGGAYDAGLLQNKTAEQIADALSNPGSSIAKGILGTANMITAYLCQLTGGQPGEVCSSAAVTVFQGTM